MYLFRCDFSSCSESAEIWHACSFCVTQLQSNRPKVSNEAEMSKTVECRNFDQISARPNRAPYPRIRSCNSVKRLNFSSNSHSWMEHMQKVTNNNHVKFDIHTLTNMEVTRTFMFNLHIQTSWPKCVGHCAFFPNCCNIRSLPPPPPPPPPPPMQCWTTLRQAFPYEQHCMGGGGGGGGGRIWPKERLFPCEKLIDGRGSAFCKLVPHHFG